MNKNLRRAYLTLLFIGFSLSTNMLWAQFYNGHQMTFGKNRVQYNDFYWQYYRFPKFDTYFYVGGNRIAQYVAEVAAEELEQIEYELEEILQRRMIFIVYNKQSEFRQSNIGLVTGNEEYNIGGVTKIVDNKVFVYFNGDHQELRRQIRASITEVLINEMLFGGNFRNRLSSSTMLNLPEWFIPGLISYVAYDTDYITESKIKTGMLSGKYEKIHRLYGEEAKYAGHAFWRYLSETYGDNIISGIIYMTRVSKSVETGFLYVLGMPFKDILFDFQYYYEGRYNSEINERQSIPSERNDLRKKTKKHHIYSQAKIAPNGKYIAYTTNHEGQYKIFLHNPETQKTKRLLKKEDKLEQIIDNTYPMLAWHPNGEILTYITEDRGKITLNFYTLASKETQSREVFYLDKVLDYSFSNDGLEIVLSAVEDGYTDIFIYSIVASSFNQVTNDIADDINPQFINNNREIIFSSNREYDELPTDKKTTTPTRESFDLFTYSVPDQTIKRLTNTKNTDETRPLEYRRGKYFYLSNENGINNQAFIAMDSTISTIDTAIHYRFFTRDYLVSNRGFSLSEFDYDKSGNLFSEVVPKYERFNLYTTTPNIQLKPEPDEVQDTWFKSYRQEKQVLDSAKRAQKESSTKVDSIYITTLEKLNRDTLIDINFYRFEVEKKDAMEALSSNEEKEDNKGFSLPKQMVYFTNFYSNLLVTQVDFGFMNQSYQVFTGNAFYYNPGVNILTKVGAIDLFEDYKITAGIRLSVDFESNEYLLSLENLKHQLDKNYIYHRQVFESSNEEYYSKIFSNSGMAVFTYPLSQIQAFKGTASLRFDERVYKSTDLNSLNKANEYRVWGGLKLEYILDNTKKPGVNLYEGTKLKVFGEYYNKLDSETNQNMFVVGADIRNYIPIHRGMIFASRFAASTSFGNSLLMYYLGGVDNWMNFSTTNPTFDNSTEINYEKNWAYQAVATNMRGFIQNARNGNSFALLNAELRWPVMRYFFNRPISNDLLNNFMVVGFADAGSAWEGFNPLTANNAYDYETIENGPVTVVIDKKHSPFVAGVGFGLRTRLLGYYIRTDWAWGIDSGRMLPRVFYLSLCTDF